MGLQQLRIYTAEVGHCLGDRMTHKDSTIYYRPFMGKVCQQPSQVMAGSWDSILPSVE